MTRKTFFLILTAIIVTGSGCTTSTSTPPQPTAGPLVKPAMGSSYTTYHEERDSSGKVTVSDTIVTTVSTLGTTWDKKSDVDILLNNEGTVSRPEYIHYEADGDLSIWGVTSYMGYTIPGVWLTFPFYSGTTFTLERDTSGTIGGVNATLKLMYSITKVANSDITVAGSNYVAEQVRVVLSASAIGPLGVTIKNETQTSNYWFVPDFGYFAKSDASAFGTSNAQSQSLVRFTLK